jgi:hypothetical protein
MRKRTALIPNAVAPLECRVALSHATAAAALVQSATIPVQDPIHLVGSVQGGQAFLPTPPDTLKLAGGGFVSPLGETVVAGTLTIKSGEPTLDDGTVTLSDKVGSIGVHIFGIEGGRTGPRGAVRLRYTITGGTGAFLGATGSGVVVYAAKPSPLAHRVGGLSLFSLTFSPPTAATTWTVTSSAE